MNSPVVLYVFPALSTHKGVFLMEQVLGWVFKSKSITSKYCHLPIVYQAESRITGKPNIFCSMCYDNGRVWNVRWQQTYLVNFPSQRHGGNRLHAPGHCLHDHWNCPVEIKISVIEAPNINKVSGRVMIWAQCEQLHHWCVHTPLTSESLCSAGLPD